MEPVIISETIQEFDGVRYYLCGHYFQHRGSRLHRKVWMSVNGPIPKGHHVHHVDGNRAHNALSNLELKEGREHSRLHMMTPERREQSRVHVKKAIAAAPAWHRSEAGRLWHLEHAKALGAATKKKWMAVQAIQHLCYWCLNEFPAKAGSYFRKAVCRTQAHKHGITVSELKKFGLKPLRMSMIVR